MADGPVGARADPARWAYRLRDAVALVRPDWIVTHHDPSLEADALLEPAGGGSLPADLADLVDVELAAKAPVSAHVELTGVLAGLFPAGVVAASITGPAGLCAALTGDGAAGSAGLDPEVLADCGDVLAELASAYVAAGASRILVWEPAGSAAPAEQLADAHAPIARRLAMLGVPGVLCGGAGVRGAGYSAHALGEGGDGALLVRPDVFEPTDPPGSFERLWDGWADRLPSPAGEALPPLVVSAGPLPRGCDMALLRAAGERPR